MGERNPEKRTCKRPLGRPSSYIPDHHIPLVKSLMGEFGFNISQLAKVLGISIDTLKLWCNGDQRLVAAISEGRDEFDCRLIEKSLRRRAMGYTTKEERVFCTVIDGEPVVTRVGTYKTYPPETRALMFYLSNRSPKRWRINPQERDNNSDGLRSLITAIEKGLIEPGQSIEGDE